MRTRILVRHYPATGTAPAITWYVPQRQTWLGRWRGFPDPDYNLAYDWVVPAVAFSTLAEAQAFLDRQVQGASLQTSVVAHG